MIPTLYEPFRHNCGEKRTIYASDGKYFLVKFSDEEKENYMKLMFPENGTSEFYKQEENRELFLLQKATRIAQEQSGIKKVQKGCQMDYGLNLEEQEEVVYRYHLLPNVFLK